MDTASVAEETMALKARVAELEAGVIANASASKSAESSAADTIRSLEDQLRGEVAAHQATWQALDAEKHKVSAPITFFHHRSMLTTV